MQPRTTLASSLDLPALGRGSVLGRIVVLCTVTVLLAACGEDRAGPETGPTYRVTAGPCGHLVFVENVGADSAAAVDAMWARTAEKHGEITLELRRLEVVDRHGNVPEARFYALYFRDAESGHFVSASYVITTEGDLFRLQWCPD